jgi:hypothetical protein
MMARTIAARAPRATTIPRVPTIDGQMLSRRGAALGRRTLVPVVGAWLGPGKDGRVVSTDAKSSALLALSDAALSAAAAPVMLGAPATTGDGSA